MSNLQAIRQIGAATVIILVLDAIYMYVNADVISRQIVSVQKFALKLRWTGAVLCYLVLVLGLYYFILRTHRPVMDAFYLGIVIYGVYEFTNYASLKNWNNPAFVAMDMLWGGIVLSLTTFLVYKLKL
jgi:uncharacterized membrane protein